MDRVLSADFQVLAFIQQHFHNPLTDFLFPLVTYLGELGACWIFLALVLLFIKKYRRAGAVMLIAMALGALLGEGIIKNIVCRPRPFQYFDAACPLLIDPPSGYSFPSGHSCASFAAATALFLQHRRAGSLALVLAALIAFSRVFLFVHFPTDILAGALLGILLAVAVTLACKRWFMPPLPTDTSGRGSD